MHILKEIIKKLLKRVGYRIVKLDNPTFFDNIYSKFSQVNKEIVDIEKLGIMSLSIPGMITQDSGKFLYSLCYMQEINGDVVEIGSWQGRSTIFLGTAVKESKNGNFYAVDHFKGNIGKEDLYEVDGKLNNLKENFIENIKKFGLNETVNLLEMMNYEAAKKLKNNNIRFLFIDGDHTEDGVTKDIELFFPMLIKGSIIVFDDYFDGFPGLINAVDSAITKFNFTRCYYYKHTLVVKV